MSTATTILESPLVKDGKERVASSWFEFAGTIAVIPIWLITVVPLSVGYQLLKYGYNKLLAPFPDDQALFLDSGYAVDSTRIIPLTKRKYDIVVLGATGFAGRLAVRHLAKTYGVNKTVRWAIAGRTQTKLNHVKEELSKELNNPDILNVDTLIVDTGVPATLPTLVENTRCVATTAGPYGMYGSSVVEFCVKFGTHYVDITGEVPWVKNMRHKWHDTARKTGAVVVSFCGNDCIPWDLTVSTMRDLLREKADGDMLQEVTIWDDVHSQPSGGTMATVLSSINGNMMPMPKCEIDPFEQNYEGKKAMTHVECNLPAAPEPANDPWDKAEPTPRWTIPFVLAAVNGEIVKWSHALRASDKEPGFTYKEAEVMKDFKSAFVKYVGFILFGTALFNPITLALMENVVIPKPGEGPKMEDMSNKFYLCVRGEGLGRNGNRVRTVFYVPRDPGYLDTARFLVEAGLCMALDVAAVNKLGGGFYTPAFALGNALLKRLQDTGTTFTSHVYRAGEK